jgi:hypothetical protein
LGQQQQRTRQEFKKNKISQLLEGTKDNKRGAILLYRKRFKNLMDAKMWLELLTKEISKF